MQSGVITVETERCGKKKGGPFYPFLSQVPDGGLELKRIPQRGCWEGSSKKGSFCTHRAGTTISLTEGVATPENWVPYKCFSAHCWLLGNTSSPISTYTSQETPYPCVTSLSLLVSF